MKECDHLKTRTGLYRICTGDTSISKWKVNQYRQKWGLDPLYPEETPPENNNTHTRPKPRFAGKKKRLEPKDYDDSYPGPGTQLLKIYEEKGVPKCQACFTLAMKMNRWGPSVCKERIDQIVEDILPRAMDWIQENKPWIHSLLPNIIEEKAVETVIRSDINKAILKSEEELKTYKRKSTRSQRKKAKRTGGGCGCGK